MPAALTYNLMNDRLNWYYTTEPQPHLDGRKLYWPRGRVLGGSSSLNAMVYIRGHALDYDRWVEEGAAGWSYAEVLPYFKRAETFSGGGDAYRGDSGPLHVTRGTTANPLFDAWIDAGRRGGLPADRRHERLSAGRHGPDGHDHPPGPPLEHGAGLSPPGDEAAEPDRLTGCLPPASCWRGSAPWVSNMSRAARQQALAAREVILAGGAINSPQLLMLSGIGPADELAAAGVRAVHDLPGVGQNLQDHLESTSSRCLEPISC